MNVVKNVILLILILFSLSLSANGAYVHKFNLIPETTVTIQNGNPHAVMVDSTSFNYFMDEEYLNPPQRLTLKNIEIYGVYTFVLFRDVTANVPDYVNNLTDTYTSTFWTEPEKRILNDSFIFVSDDWMLLSGTDGTSIEMLRLNVTTKEVNINFYTFYEPRKLAIYYEDEGNATFTYRIDQLDRFTYLFENKEVLVQSGSYWTEVMTLNLSSYLVLNVSEINADGRLTFVFLSNSDESVHEDYTQYFKTYEPEVDPFTNQDVYYNSRKDKLVIFTLDEGKNASFMALFNFGDHDVYDFPPDDKPFEIRLIVYYKGNGDAKMSLDAYQFPGASPLIPWGQSPRTDVQKSPLPVFMIAVGLILARKLKTGSHRSRFSN